MSSTLFEWNDPMWIVPESKRPSDRSSHCIHFNLVNDTTRMACSCNIGKNDFIEPDVCLDGVGNVRFTDFHYYFSLARRDRS